MKAPTVPPTSPKHLKIADRIREELARGRWEAEDRLPPYSELAEEHDTSIQTIQRAMRLLRADGLIRTVPGGGAYAAGEPGVDGARERYRRGLETGHAMGADERTEIVDTGIAEDPPEVVVAALGLEDRPAAYRKRVVWQADQPIEVSTSWWDAEILGDCPHLIASTTSKTAAGTSRYIEECSGRKLVEARDRVRARGATEEEAEALHLQAGDPVLSVQHRTFDEEGRTVEICLATFSSGRWREEEPYALASPNEMD